MASAVGPPSECILHIWVRKYIMLCLYMGQGWVFEKKGNLLLREKCRKVKPKLYRKTKSFQKTEKKYRPISIIRITEQNISNI